MSWRIFLGLLVCGLTGWLVTNSDYKFYIVQSGSMEPTLQIYDMIVTKRLARYNVGDVVTFNKDDKKLITHRVSKVNDSGQLLTKGDANQIEDSVVVNKNDTVGKVVLVIPKIGFLANLAQTNKGYWLFILVPAIISIADLIAVKA